MSTLVLDENPELSLRCLSDLTPSVKAAAVNGFTDWQKIKTSTLDIDDIQTWLADEENSDAHRK